MKPPRRSATPEFQKPIDPAARQRYLLRLYVTGMTPRSTEAIAHLKEICEEHLAECYELEIIDLYQQPQLAQGEQIIATPTLIKKLPHPLRRLVGDLSNKERVLVGLDIWKTSEPRP